MTASEKGNDATFSVTQTVRRLTALDLQPLVLGAPVDVLFRFPDILTPAAEAEGLEAHRFQGDVPGEDHRVDP